MLEEMMERRNGEQLPFEIPFPENLEETRTQIYDKEEEKDEKRDDDAGPHVEEIQQRSDQTS